MEIKDFIRGGVHGVTFNFTLSSFAMVAHSLVLGAGLVSVRDIVAVFILAVLLYLPNLALCSARALKRNELLVRHILRLISIIVIVLSVATFMSWIRWSEPITIILFVIFIAVIYGIGIAMEFYESKMLMDKMNKKLKERHRG